MNCTIVIEQKEGDTIRQNLYQFNDYRVAQAICNILDNVVDVISERCRLDNCVRGMGNE